MRTTQPKAKFEADITPTFAWLARSPIADSSSGVKPVEPDTHRTPLAMQVRIAALPPSALVKSMTTSGMTVPKRMSRCDAKGRSMPPKVETDFPSPANASAPPTGTIPGSSSTAFNTVEPIRPNTPLTATVISVISTLGVVCFQLSKTTILIV